MYTITMSEEERQLFNELVSIEIVNIKSGFLDHVMSEDKKTERLDELESMLELVE